MDWCINTEKSANSYGHCRCCLAEGNHRELTRVYKHAGVTEVYADIFLDCFNVFLSTHTNLTSLICESCVSELRNARDFKKLVLKTEEKLIDALQDSDNEQMVVVNVPITNKTLDTTIGFKIQVQEFEKRTKSTLFPVVEPEEASVQMPLPLKEELRNTSARVQMPLPLKEELGNVSASMQMPLPLKEELVNASASVQIPMPIEENCSNSTDNDTDEDESKTPTEEKFFTKHIDLLQPKKRDKMALIYNTFTLLENCNATIFKSKMRSGFPCYYCKEILDSFSSLRFHQTQEHDRSTMVKALKSHSAESLVVYADVTNLKCILCDSDIPNLKELKSHLVENHEKRFYDDVSDRVVPFKLSDTDNYFECTICEFNFETFGAAERHMNTHFKNYVCEVCGSGFVTVLRLKTHLNTLHKEGNYPCDYCDKVFTTQLRQKGHVDFVHKMLKKLKCQKCSERFSDYFVQKKHMVEVHGELPIVYRCKVCSRGFNRRYTLLCHMKRHLEQKDVQCEQCPYSCYNKTELREHMLKHNKHNLERLFQCNICDKTFSRKKTLKEHIRIHTDDRRFVCKFCDQAFVQSNSLKTHMRNHHCYFATDGSWAHGQTKEAAVISDVPEEIDD